MISLGPALDIMGPVLRDLSPVVASLVLSVATTLLTAIPAYICFRFVEVPGIAFGRKAALLASAEAVQVVPIEIPIAEKGHSSQP
jgi:peptidoglycan/LPS O-acetylase OafA/YrhL